MNKKNFTEEEKNMPKRTRIIHVTIRAASKTSAATNRPYQTDYSLSKVIETY